MAHNGSGTQVFRSRSSWTRARRFHLFVSLLCALAVLYIAPRVVCRRPLLQHSSHLHSYSPCRATAVRRRALFASQQPAATTKAPATPTPARLRRKGGAVERYAAPSSRTAPPRNSDGGPPRTCTRVPPPSVSCRYASDHGGALLIWNGARPRRTAAVWSRARYPKSPIKRFVPRSKSPCRRSRKKRFNSITAPQRTVGASYARTQAAQHRAAPHGAPKTLVRKKNSKVASLVDRRSAVGRRRSAIAGTSFYCSALLFHVLLLPRRTPRACPPALVFLRRSRARATAEGQQPSHPSASRPHSVR